MPGLVIQGQKSKRRIRSWKRPGPELPWDRSRRCATHNSVQNRVVASGLSAVDLVVGAHQRARFRAFNGDLKLEKVGLAISLLIESASPEAQTMQTRRRDAAPSHHSHARPWNAYQCRRHTHLIWEALILTSSKRDKVRLRQTSNFQFRVLPLHIRWRGPVTLPRWFNPV